MRQGHGALGTKEHNKTEEETLFSSSALRSHLIKSGYMVDY
jgi:hypothetical protein